MNRQISWMMLCYQDSILRMAGTWWRPTIEIPCILYIVLSKKTRAGCVQFHQKRREWSGGSSAVPTRHVFRGSSASPGQVFFMSRLKNTTQDCQGSKTYPTIVTLCSFQK